MKTLKQLTIRLTIIMAAVSFVVGCAKSGSQSTGGKANNGTTTTVVPIIIDPAAPVGTGSGGSIVDTGSYGSGSNVVFQPVSLSVMNKYVATHPLNNPTNFRLNINLAQAAAGKYGGDVSISYQDNGIQYNGVFKAGMGRNRSFKGMYDNDTLEANYNYWFNYQNQLVFTGFFEDQYGAITLTLVPESTNYIDQGDGQPIPTASYKGYVYFKNFTTTFAPHGTERACWFIYTGPYDCRSNVIQTKCGLTPGAEAGYELLGTFSGVVIRNAFNIQ